MGTQTSRKHICFLSICTSTSSECSTPNLQDMKKKQPASTLCLGLPYSLLATGGFQLLKHLAVSTWAWCPWRSLKLELATTLSRVCTEHRPSTIVTVIIKNNHTPTAPVPSLETQLSNFFLELKRHLLITFRNGHYLIGQQIQIKQQVAYNCSSLLHVRSLYSPHVTRWGWMHQ